MANLDFSPSSFALSLQPATVYDLVCSHRVDEVSPVMTALCEQIPPSTFESTSATTWNKLILRSFLTGLWTAVTSAPGTPAFYVIWMPLWVLDNSENSIEAVVARATRDLLDIEPPRRGVAVRRRLVTNLDQESFLALKSMSLWFPSVCLAWI